MSRARLRRCRRRAVSPSLGLCPNACGGRALENTVVGEVPLTNGSTEASGVDPTTPAPAPPGSPSTPNSSTCGPSTPQMSGEVAAMEASEARLAATKPCVRSALDVIDVDESNHARLAWQFVQWALSRPESNGSLRRVVAHEFAAAVQSARASHPSVRSSPTSVDAPLAHLGVLDDATRAAVRFAALTEVIAPCAAELLRATEPLDARPALTLAS